MQPHGIITNKNMDVVVITGATKRANLQSPSTYQHWSLFVIIIIIFFLNFNFLIVIFNFFNFNFLILKLILKPPSGSWLPRVKK